MEGASWSELAAEQRHGVEKSRAEVRAGKVRPRRPGAPAAQRQMRLERAPLRRKAGRHRRTLAVRLESHDGRGDRKTEPQNPRLTTVREDAQALNRPLCDRTGRSDSLESSSQSLDLLGGGVPEKPQRQVDPLGLDPAQLRYAGPESRDEVADSRPHVLGEIEGYERTNASRVHG